MPLNPISSLWTDLFQHNLKNTVFWNMMSCCMVGLHITEYFLEILAPLGLLHGVTFQKAVSLTLTAVRTSKLDIKITVGKESIA
jgi:hypothetical protein